MLLYGFTVNHQTLLVLGHFLASMSTDFGASHFEPQLLARHLSSLWRSRQWAVLCVSHRCPREDTGSSTSFLLSSLPVNHSRTSGKALNTSAWYALQPLCFVHIKETNKLLSSSLCSFVFLISYSVSLSAGLTLLATKLYSILSGVQEIA